MNLRGNSRVIFMVAGVMIISMVYVLKPQDIRRETVYSRMNYPAWLKSSDEMEHMGYLVYTPRCKIPYVEPWDGSIRSFFRSPVSVQCSKRPLLSSVERLSNDTYLLKIDKKLINLYATLNKAVFQCCYSDITRVSQTGDNYDSNADNKISYSQCHNFKGQVLLPNQTEFIRVRCMIKRKNKPEREVYRDAHALVPIIPSALRKIQDYDQRIIKSMPSNKTQEMSRKRRLNVMLIGIDSVSRLHLRRLMPKTLKYLKFHQWVELSGYTKIADNTFPNLMAILTGLHMKELHDLCYKNRSQSMDSCPYIWKDFSDVGYVTAYAEDTPNISTFNYLRTGFVDKPTDYYLRPFMVAVHSSLTARKFFGLPVCVGPVTAVDHILNYARRFLTTFRKYNHFSLFWMNSLSHNDPSLTENMDQRIYKFLDDLTEIGTYENTVVLLLSDHGTRFGKFRHTFVGYYEERLPFIFMWFPEWFRKEYPDLYSNVLNNQKRLTCPFDVHLTIRSILNQSYDGGGEARPLSVCPKCLSLFEEVPVNRDCKDAAIDRFWCMCDEFKRVSASDRLVTRIGRGIRDVVQNRTTALVEKEGIKDSPCSTWSFVKVVRAHEMQWVESPSRRQFVILVELDPGKTRFEAMVEVEGDSYAIKYTPSILDGYGKFSKCVESPQLKYFCYCKNA